MIHIDSKHYSKTFFNLQMQMAWETDHMNESAAFYNPQR
jgi:hypothetical protein